jgi:hypothetical protein
MKRTISVVLAFFMIFGFLTPSAFSDQRNSFTDVGNTWYFEAVQHVFENGIMQGTSANTFSPHNNLTRAEVTALLFRLYHGHKASINDLRWSMFFEDVSRDKWYSPYIAWASEREIVNGISEVHFGPYNTITRQEFATLLFRYNEYVDGCKVHEDVELTEFADNYQVAEWASEAMLWALCSSRGILTVRAGDTLAPTAGVTRAEAAAIMKSYMTFYGCDFDNCDVCINDEQDDNDDAPQPVGGDVGQPPSGGQPPNGGSGGQPPGNGGSNQQPDNGDDFILTISVEETTLPQDENFRVNVELKNNSGEDHEIAYMFLFTPNIPGEHWIASGRVPPPWPFIELFENGSTISRVINLDWYYELSPGVYQLTIEAIFFIDWDQPPPLLENGYISWDITNSAQQINITSNTIELTVEPIDKPPCNGNNNQQLCPDLAARIKLDWLQFCIFTTTIDGVRISEYFGTYRGSVVLMINCICCYFADVVWEEEVAGRVFLYRDSQRILVWNDGAFYDLSGANGAYELGLLTAEDIFRVHLRFEQARPPWNRPQFDDDAVVLVLTREASRDNRTFTIQDFPDVGAVYVEDLSRLSDREYSFARRIWDAQIALQEYYALTGQVNPELLSIYLDARADGAANTLVNFDEFRRILLIRLDQNCKENVLYTVQQLKQHEFVHVAEPNFIHVPN